MRCLGKLMISNAARVVQQAPASNRPIAPQPGQLAQRLVLDDEPNLRLLFGRLFDLRGAGAMDRAEHLGWQGRVLNKPFGVGAFLDACQDAL